MAFLFKVWLSVLAFTEAIPIIFLFKRRLVRKPLEKFPPVSVLIPTRNEEEIIEEVVKKWDVLDYSGFKEIIVCDRSTDATPRILKNLVKRYSIIYLDCRKAKSKLGQLVLGIKKAKNNILVISDADKFPKKGALKKGLGYLLANKKVGAVFGKTLAPNTDSLWEKLFSIELLNKYLDQLFYSGVDSAPYLSLGSCIIRKEAVFEIPVKKVVADDLYLALFIRKKGLRCLFVPEAFGEEKPITHPRDLITKRLRVSQGTAQIALTNYFSSVFNPKFGSLGFFLLPFRQVSFLGVNLLLGGLILGMPLGLFRGSVLLNEILSSLFITYLVCLFVFSLRVLSFKKLNISPKKFLPALPFYPLYYLFFYRFFGTVALYLYLLGIRVAWRKTVSDRPVRI